MRAVTLSAEQLVGVLAFEIELRCFSQRDWVNLLARLVLFDHSYKPYAAASVEHSAMHVCRKGYGTACAKFCRYPRLGLMSAEGFSLKPDCFRLPWLCTLAAGL